MYIKRNVKKKLAYLIVILMVIIVFLFLGGVISDKIQYICLAILAAVTTVGAELPESSDYVWTMKKVFSLIVTIVLGAAVIYVAVS